MTLSVDAVWTRVICKQPGRYIGWPTIARTKSGELLAVFSGDRDAHICPWGKTHLVRSDDDGETWSAPEVIRDSPLDDRDAGIIDTARGMADGCRGSLKRAVYTSPKAMPRCCPRSFRTPAPHAAPRTHTDHASI